MINLELAKQRGISGEGIDEICSLHSRREYVMENLELCTKEDSIELRIYGRYLEYLEKRLQTIWGFEWDASKTYFWNLPHCVCPKMDNEDNVGSGFVIYNLSCPLHKHHMNDDE